jgi:gluconate 2-dehydrogenase gamma chain
VRGTQFASTLRTHSLERSMEKISRRSFFKIAGATAAAKALEAHGATAKMPATPSQSYTFLQPDEARFLEAATERLIPADENGPGAREADVVFYIDRQLAGAWGAGDRLYRTGPWHEGAPTQGYQLPYTPAELFRHALRGIHNDLAKRGKPFEKMAAQEQDAYLKSLEGGKVDLDGVPSNVFFETLLELTIEGFFVDPVYGGNRDMVSWKMIGFPGAYANYYQLVDQHGIQYSRAPMSLAENGKGMIHIHPDISTHPGQQGK